MTAPACASSARLKETTTPQGTLRLLRRSVPYLCTVGLLVVLNFLLPRAMPGDPIEAMTASAALAGVQGPDQDEDSQAALRRYYGLDKPLTRQFTSYVSGLATGDLGISISQRVPVSTLLAERLPWSLLLVGSSILIAAMVGGMAGLNSGWRARRRGGGASVAVFIALRETPSYLLATGAVLVFAATLGWAPLGGATDPNTGSLGLAAKAADMAHHLALPVSVLASQLCASTFLLMRAGVVQELGSGYLLLGKAKGLSERRLEYAYAGRNAVLATFTHLALQVGSAVSGAVFIETVFSYPGIGRLIFESIAARDYPVLQGTFLLLSVTVVTANLVADLVYARLDPRVAQ